MHEALSSVSSKHAFILTRPRANTFVFSFNNCRFQIKKHANAHYFYDLEHELSNEADSGGCLSALYFENLIVFENLRHSLFVIWGQRAPYSLWMDGFRNGPLNLKDCWHLFSRIEPFHARSERYCKA
jgi:hypothetical protein